MHDYLKANEPRRKLLMTLDLKNGQAFLHSEKKYIKNNIYFFGGYTNNIFT